MRAARELPGTLQEVPFRDGANILSVDVEMWHETSCVDETVYLLDLFRQKRARATFFVLGSVARREPDLVRRIAAEGHEVGSHGWNHDPVLAKSPARFRDEMKRSFDTLSTLAGTPIAGYRAPHFSIAPETYWALDVLADVGFEYDSSIFPFAGPRYGIPGFPRRPVRITRGGRSILEVPLSTVRAWGANLPVAGGGYFRLLPYPLIRGAVRSVNAEGLPFVVYCHPYEFRRAPLSWPPGPGLLGRARAAARGARFNVLRETMRGKLERLLDAFRFTTVHDALGDALDAFRFTTVQEELRDGVRH
jgi:polysaccharide deacetylase family protein (PEP-CTERM system associated)